MPVLNGKAVAGDKIKLVSLIKDISGAACNIFGNNALGEEFVLTNEYHVNHVNLEKFSCDYNAVVLRQYKPDDQFTIVYDPVYLGGMSRRGETFVVDRVNKVEGSISCPHSVAPNLGRCQDYYIAYRNFDGVHSSVWCCCIEPYKEATKQQEPEVYENKGRKLGPAILIGIYGQNGIPIEKLQEADKLLEILKNETF